MLKKLGMGLLALLLVSSLLFLGCPSDSDDDPETEYVTITFDAQGGTVDPAEKEIVKGAAIGELPTPVLANNVFSGWFSAAEGGEPVTTETTFSEDATIFAQWTPVGENQRTVTFNADGGTPAPAQQVVDVGGKATAPAAMTKAGFNFDAWYKEAAFTNKWDFAVDTVTENITLYAKWIEILPAGTVILAIIDGDENSSVSEDGKLATIVSSDKAGFYFTFADAGITPAAGHTITINYETKKISGTGTMKAILKNDANSIADLSTARYPTLVEGTGEIFVAYNELAAGATGITIQHNIHENDDISYYIGIVSVTTTPPITQTLGEFIILENITAPAWASTEITLGNIANSDFPLGPITLGYYIDTWGNTPYRVAWLDNGDGGLSLRIGLETDDGENRDNGVDIGKAGGFFQVDDVLNVKGKVFAPGAAPDGNNRAIVLCESGGWGTVDQSFFNAAPSSEGQSFELEITVSSGQVTNGVALRINNNHPTNQATHFIIESITITRP